MTAFHTVALVNCAICAAIAVACFATGSAWPLLALTFLMETKHRDEK